MHIIKKKTLKEFWESHSDSKEPLLNWYEQARTQSWATPQDVKDFRGDASILPDNRVVFNIKGNDYRLIVRMNYEYKKVFIRFIGTHAEYDKIDATSI